MMADFEASLSDLGLDSKSQGRNRAIVSVPITWQNSQWIWKELDILWRLVGLLNAMLILLVRLGFKGENTT